MFLSHPPLHCGCRTRMCTARIVSGTVFQCGQIFHAADSDAGHCINFSRYPIILSFENHCSLKQQDRMAHHLRSILKERLFTGPVTTADKMCPSPAKLKGKVLVKAKKLPEEIKHDAEVDLDKPEILGEDKGEGDHEPTKHPLKEAETPKVSKALSDCVYLKAVKFKGTLEQHKDGT